MNLTIGAGVVLIKVLFDIAPTQLSIEMLEYQFPSVDLVGCKLTGDCLMLIFEKINDSVLLISKIKVVQIRSLLIFIEIFLTLLNIVCLLVNKTTFL